MTESRSKYRFSRVKVKIRHLGGVLSNPAQLFIKFGLEKNIFYLHYFPCTIFLLKKSFYKFISDLIYRYYYVHNNNVIITKTQPELFNFLIQNILYRFFKICYIDLRYFILI